MGDTIARCNARGKIGAELLNWPSGKSYVNARFEVIDGKFAGAVYSWQPTVTDKTREWIVKGLLAAGCDPEKIKVSDFSGLEKNIVQITLEDEGEYGVRVGFVNDPGGREIRPQDRANAAQKKAAGAMLMGALSVLKGGSSAPRPAASSLGADPFAVKAPADTTDPFAVSTPANDQPAAETSAMGSAAEQGEPLGATGTDDQIPF